VQGVRNRNAGDAVKVVLSLKRPQNKQHKSTSARVEWTLDPDAPRQLTIGMEEGKTIYQ
jgi:hypothetical protein